MSQQSSQSPIKRATIMTDDIKDIVERASLAVKEAQAAFNMYGLCNKDYAGDIARLISSSTEAITALTTLSEDNAAMKLEIVDYIENLADSRKLVSSLQDEVLELRQALKDNTNA